MTDGVLRGRARAQLQLRVFVADGAGQAGLERAVRVREGVVQTRLAHGVVIEGAVRVHALPRGTHRARLAAAGDDVEEEAVVADAHGVVGVGARRLEPHQARALCARPALLRVAVVL